MAEPVVADTSSTFSSAIPPPRFANSSSDQAPLGNSTSDLRFLIGGNGDGDFELTLDSIHDLHFPSEHEIFFVVPVDATEPETSGDFTTMSGISGEDADTNAKGVLISTSSLCNQESPTDSDCSVTAQSLTLSTQEPANLEATNALKEKATTYKTSVTKRQKEIEEDTSDEFRNNKYRRILDQDGFTSIVTGGGGGEENDDKRNVRLIRNRESAHLSRQRKKHYVEELQDKVKNMHSSISELNSKMSYFMAENVTLRQQVGPGSGMSQTRYPPPLPRSGLYPVPYPWMPCPAYMVKPQGFRVPLLPIPRLKPPESVAKVKKAKTKKVAILSVLGLLFCLFLFGALAPIVNISYGEYKSNYVIDRVYDLSRRRVLYVNSNRVHCGRDSDHGDGVGRTISATENLGPPLNTSEPLVASLFVPRNEKLVKIDGNLIIHSVLASEKAMASEKKSERKSGVGTITKGISPALPLSDSARTGDMSKHLYSETRRALLYSGSDDTSKDQVKSTSTNPKMQQWFREGVAGPMFGSGMCTEVFQFDVSSTSGVIIPASPPTQQSKNTTDTHEGKKNRRILRGGPPVSDLNLTKDHNSSSKENFRDTKPAPSMVVSVLVDPREGGDGDIDGMMGGTKSLSRVFIVFLVDGGKYLTYSCVLPRPEVPHLVTT